MMLQSTQFYTQLEDRASVNSILDSNNTYRSSQCIRQLNFVIISLIKTSLGEYGRVSTDTLGLVSTETKDQGGYEPQGGGGCPSVFT